MNKSLLPNTSKLEKITESVLSRIIKVPIEINKVRSARTIPIKLLEFLAWEKSVDNWNSEWSEEVKRQVVTESFNLHQKKGTPAALEKVLFDAGYGDAKVIERKDASLDDPDISHWEWEEYKVQMTKPLTIAQGEEVKSILANVAPARSRLLGLYFDVNLYLYNNKIDHSGINTYGAV